MTATPAAPKPKRTRSRIILISVIAGIVVLALFAAGGVLIAHFVRGNADGASADSGTTFTAPAGDYEVSFPGEPEISTVPQTAGDYELELQIATWTDGDEFYAVNSTVYPAEVMEQSLDDILTNSVSGMVQSTPGATLIESEDTELDGAQAIGGSLAIDGTDGSGTMWFTLSVFNNTQYTLISLGHDEAAHDAFVESFAFIQ